LVVFVETVNVVLGVLDISFVERQTLLFVVAVWNDAGKRIEFQSSLFAR
jgi:hypothetical protein